MTILLQVLSGKEQLFVGLNLFHWQGSLSAVRYRTYLIRLCMPLQHYALFAVECLIYSQVQVIKCRSFHIYAFRQYHLWRKSLLLVIQRSTVIGYQLYPHFLL